MGYYYAINRNKQLIIATAEMTLKINMLGKKEARYKRQCII